MDAFDKRGTIIRLIVMSLHIDWKPLVSGVFQNGIKHVGLTFRGKYVLSAFHCANRYYQYDIL